MFQINQMKGYYAPEELYAERIRLKAEGKPIGLLMLLLLAVNLAVGNIIVLFLIFTGVITPEATGLPYWGLGNTVYMGVYAVMYICYMALPLIITIGAYRVKFRPFSEAQPFRFKNTALLVAAGMAFSVLANFLTSIFLNILSMFGLNLNNPIQMMENTVESYLLNAVVLAVLPCIFEELVFRGFILGSLRRYGDGFAILISSLLFGLLHQNLVQIPFAIILGLGFGFIVVKTGNLWAAIILHFLNNFLSVTMEYISLNLPEGLYMSVFYSTEIVITLIGLLAVLYMVATKSPLLQPVSGQVSPLTKGKQTTALLSHPLMILTLIGMGITTVINTIMN